MSERTVTVRLRALITDYQKALQTASGETKTFTQAVKGNFAQLKTDVGGLGESLTRRVTVPLVATGAGALKLASDFETAFAQMVGLAGVAADEVDGLRESVLNLAQQTATSPQKLAEALYFIRSSGIDAAHAMDVLTASAKASAAGLGDPAVVARTVSAALNAYGDANLSAAHATDVLVAGIRAASFEPDELAASLGTVIATASTMGISFDQLVGTLAVLSRTGLNAAEATTSLNAVLATLQNNTPAATALLQEHGLTLEQLRTAAAGPGGVVEAMRMLDRAFAGNDQELSTIIPNIRAFRGAMTILAQDSSKVDKVLQDVTNSTGSLDDAFAAVKDNWSFKLKQGIVEVQIALVRIGELLGPMAAFFGTTIGAIVSEFNKLPVAIQQIAVSFVAVSAAAGPALKVISTLAGPAVTSIKGIVSAVTALRVEFVAMQLAGYTQGQALVATLAPMGVALAAASAAAFIGYRMLKNYADQKKQAAERTREFTAALKEEHDVGLDPGKPPPTQTASFKLIFSSDQVGGKKLSTDLRESGADMTYFAQTVLKGNDSLEKFAITARGSSPIVLADNLKEAAATGDEFARRLLGLQAAAGLSNGDLQKLILRLFDIQRSFVGTKEATDNASYALQQAAGASGDLQAQQAALDVAVSTYAGSASDAAGATTQLGAGFDWIAFSASTAQQAIDGLLSGIAFLFGSTVGVATAQQGFADAVDDVGASTRSSGGSTRDYAAEQKSLERATKDVTQAQEDLAAAEKALVDARKGPSTRDKSDAALDVREASLAVKEATKAQADARKLLAEKRKKGKDGDIAGAQLDIERSAISLKRAQDRLTDAQKNQNEVLHSGEETSQKVTGALDDLEKAQEAVADATDRQAEAEANLAKGGGGGPAGDHARQLRGAYDNLTTSGKGWIDKLLEMGKPTSDIVIALHGQRDAVQEVIDKYGDANGQLALYLQWLRDIETQLRLADPNDPQRNGQGGGDYGVVSPPNTKVSGRASGGPVGAGATVRVTEQGDEFLTMGNKPGYVTTAAQFARMDMAPIAASGGGGAMTINLTVDRSGVMPGFDLQRLVTKAVASYAKRTGGPSVTAVRR